MAAFDEFPGYSSDFNSTAQSLARRTGAVEVDYLNGEIVLLGRLHGVATPVNLALQSVLGHAAASGIEPGFMSLPELEDVVAGFEHAAAPDVH